MNIQELFKKVYDLSDKIENSQQKNSQIFEDHEKNIKLLNQKIANQKTTLRWQQRFIIAVLLVTFLAFVSFIIDASKFHGNKTEQYQETIEKLRKENIELRIQNEVDSYLKEQKQNKNKPNKKEQK